MNRTSTALLPLLLSGCLTPGGAPPPTEGPQLPPADKPLEYVVPFIGSGGFGYAHGAAFPGAAAPHGLAKVGPDTRGPYGTINFLHYSGYWYGDDQVQGFSHLHLHGTGATDYGVLSLMPSDGFDEGRRTRDGYGSRFAKQSETARPGYYAVTLDRGAIRAELTASVHAAHHRYTFARGGARHVILDLDHHLEGGQVAHAALQQTAPGHLQGMLRSVGGMSGRYGGYDLYFAIRARRPFQAALLWKAGAQAAPAQEIAGAGVGADLDFGPGDEPVELQVGLSLVSEEGALKNLAAEMPGWDFEAEQQATQDAWERLLQVVRVEGGTTQERQIFYSALYRAFLMPSVHSDVDGRYRGHDGVVRSADGPFVSDLSLWDTYRTLHPLYAMLYPDHAQMSVRSLVEMARQRGGALPKWPLAGGDSGSMIGASADIVIADSYLRGVTGFDARGAYELARAAALDPAPPQGGRGGRNSEDYLRLAYVPASQGGSVSLTTELARDDFALAQLAAALGRKDDAAVLHKRAQGWRALYNPQVGFLRAREATGAWAEPRFDPLCFCKPYVEANAWHSLWMPSHDLDAMIGLLGGPLPFVARLQEFFTLAQANWEENDPAQPLSHAAPRPYYWAGNQPDIHAGYLFARVGRPDLTQRWVRWAMRTYYGPGPDGLPGNDDGGTMSAWYLLSALGLYPELSTDAYVIGVPLFPRVQLRLPSGTFTIEAPSVSEGRYYVHDLSLDGAPVTGPLLRHGDLRGGRTLRFTVGAEPGPWGR